MNAPPPANPFGDEPAPRRVNPFGDDEDPLADPVRRVERAVVQIRNLKGQVGAEGMSGNGMRQLLDELAAAMDAIARALRERED